MPTAKKAAPKKPSRAEQARRKFVKTKPKPKTSAVKKALAKKKISNKTAKTLIDKALKAKKLRIERQKHMLKNRPGKAGYKSA